MKKKWRISLISMLIFIFILKYIMFKIIDYEIISVWIRATIILAYELMLLLVLILFIYSDSDKRYRIGLLISLLFLFVSRFESDINNLIGFTVVVIVISSLKHYSNKNLVRSDYLKYYLIVIISLSYLFFKLNIGNQFLILTFKIISRISFVCLLLVYLIWYLPNFSISRKEILQPKLSFKSFIKIFSIYIIGLLITLAFDWFISFKIMDYKFDRYVNYNTEYYFNNQKLFQSTIKYLENIPQIPDIEFKSKSISFNFNDSTISDSTNKDLIFDNYWDNSNVQYIYFVEGESQINNIVFLDSNNLLISYHDTSFIINSQWTLSCEIKDYSNPILSNILDYFQIEKLTLYEIEEMLEALDCTTVSKDSEGNINLYKNIGGLEFSGFLFSATKEAPNEKVDTFRKLEDSVYWYHWEGCCIDFFRSYYFNRYNL